jgi:hypothetical protein
VQLAHEQAAEDAGRAEDYDSHRPARKAQTMNEGKRIAVAAISTC